MEDAGCDGCHNDMAESEYDQWALDTKNTFERLTSEEDEDFEVATFAVKGVYKAYPEYFKKYFPDDAAFKTYAAGVRPDDRSPGAVAAADRVGRQ